MKTFTVFPQEQLHVDLSNNLSDCQFSGSLEDVQRFIHSFSCPQSQDEVEVVTVAAAFTCPPDFLLQILQSFEFGELLKNARTLRALIVRLQEKRSEERSEAEQEEDNRSFPLPPTT
jgi:hypothetical protein